jgi:hypothetical protein
MAKKSKAPKPSIQIPTEAGYYWTVYECAMQLSWIENGVMTYLEEEDRVEDILDDLEFISGPVTYSEKEQKQWLADARAVAERLAHYDETGWDWQDGYYWITTPKYPGIIVGWFAEDWVVIKDYDEEISINCGEGKCDLDGKVLYGPLRWPELPKDLFTTNSDLRLTDQEIDAYIRNRAAGEPGSGRPGRN